MVQSCTTLLSLKSTPYVQAGKQMSCPGMLTMLLLCRIAPASWTLPSLAAHGGMGPAGSMEEPWAALAGSKALGAAADSSTVPATGLPHAGQHVQQPEPFMPMHTGLWPEWAMHSSGGLTAGLPGSVGLSDFTGLSPVDGLPVHSAQLCGLGLQPSGSP